MGEISGVSTDDINNVDGFFTTQSGGGGGTATTTPTGSIDFSMGTGIITISNHSSYTNPNYSVTVSIGGSVIVSDAEINHAMDAGEDSLGAVMTFTDNNASTAQRTVTVKAQEFGDNIQSAALIATYTPSFVAWRFIRVTNVNASKTLSGTSWLAINNWSLFEGVGQTGTNHPTTNLTSDTSQTGIALSSNNVYSTYYKWHAFDSNGNGTRFWSVSGDPKYLQIEFEPATYPTPPTIKSMNLSVQYGFHLLFQGSNDGTNFTEITHVGPMSSASNNAGNPNLNIG
jgi:hypothetical protein